MYQKFCKLCKNDFHVNVSCTAILQRYFWVHGNQTEPKCEKKCTTIRVLRFVWVSYFEISPRKEGAEIEMIHSMHTIGCHSGHGNSSLLQISSLKLYINLGMYQEISRKNLRESILNSMKTISSALVSTIWAALPKCLHSLSVTVYAARKARKRASGIICMQRIRCRSHSFGGLLPLPRLNTCTIFRHRANLSLSLLSRFLASEGIRMEVLIRML